MSRPLPTPETAHPAAAVVSFAPVVLKTPDRRVDLRLRVSAPAVGADLPVLLLSHGHGPSNYVSSLYGYAPLAEYYAACGFMTIQPTHLDSATLGLRDADDPDAPLYWRSRAQDMTRILDHLDDIVADVAHLRARVDRTKVAVVGHSMGGHTASLLLGATLDDPLDGSSVDLAEARISAGVLLAAPGRGGDALTPSAARSYPFLSSTDFSTMTAPTLVVRGEKDVSSHLTLAGPDWYADPYHLSPGPKALLTLSNAEHGLGGVAGYDLAETTDEDPDRVALVQHLSAAYLRTALDLDEHAWPAALDALAAADDPLGRVESKPHGSSG